jgi:hypothetical protein
MLTFRSGRSSVDADLPRDLAARGSVAGLQRVRELRGTFRAKGYVSAAAVIDERARAWGAVPV